MNDFLLAQIRKDQENQEGQETESELESESDDEWIRGKAESTKWVSRKRKRRRPDWKIKSPQRKKQRRTEVPKFTMNLRKRIPKILKNPAPAYIVEFVRSSPKPDTLTSCVSKKTEDRIEGCKQSKNVDRFLDRTAGVLSCMKTCRICVGLEEYFHCETTPQVAFFIGELFGRDKKSIEHKPRHIRYEKRIFHFQ